MDKTCYMCHSIATSKEHVPPKCIFPKQKGMLGEINLRKKLITVPSCDAHNGKKSKDDEYLMFILSSGYRGNRHKEELFKKVMRAHKRRPHVYQSFIKDPKELTLKNSLDKEIETGSFRVDRKRFDRIFHQIACGLFFDCYDKKWLGTTNVFTSLLVNLDSPNSPEVNRRIASVAKQTQKAFSRTMSIGDNDKIFTYRILDGGNHKYGMHLTFYQGIEITILLG